MKMKGAISFRSCTALNSANLSIYKHYPNNSQLYTKSSFPSLALPNLHNNNFSIRKAKHTLVSTTTTTMMSTSFNPDQARVPPILPLPSPPLTKCYEAPMHKSSDHIISGVNLTHFDRLDRGVGTCEGNCCSIFKIALCQLLVTTNKERNIAHARKAIEEAANKGAQLILLPEIWNSPYSNDSFPVYAEDIDAGGDASPSTAMLSELSQSLQITIVGGSIPERSGDRLYNTCCVFGTDGKLMEKHRKIHLFDIDIPGQMTFKESLTLTAGESPTIVDTDVGRIGIGICYDIRFQELAMVNAARGVLTYFAILGHLTRSLVQCIGSYCRGQADCQLFVATCSPARDSGAGYVAWGHSTLVGPFGEVIATTEHDEAIVIAEIDYSLIDLRRNIPSISEAKARGFVPVGRCFEAEFHGTQVTKFRNCQVREDAEF
ncbi:unnamed protein product [Camellia sinensis]